MAFQTIVAKFDASCRRCGGTVKCGDTVRWLRGRGVWHLKADCHEEADASIEAAGAALTDEEVLNPDRGELIAAF